MVVLSIAPIAQRLVALADAARELGAVAPAFTFEQWAAELREGLTTPDRAEREAAANLARLDLHISVSTPVASPDLVLCRRIAARALDVLRGEEGGAAAP